jgi:hypothetical protein
MRPRDLLGVAIRAFGLWSIYQGLYECFFMLLRQRASTAAFESWQYGALATFHLVLGIFLLVMADLVVRAVYGAAIEPGEG